MCELISWMMIMPVLLILAQLQLPNNWVIKEDAHTNMCIIVLKTWWKLTLFLLGVVVLLVNVHFVVYGVRQQLKGVHHLNVSTLLFPNQSSNHWGERQTQQHMFIFDLDFYSNARKLKIYKYVIG